MPIDNDVYNREGEGWWEEDNPLNVLREHHTRPFRILPQGPDGPARSRPSRSGCPRHRVRGRLSGRRVRAPRTPGGRGGSFCGVDRDGTSPRRRQRSRSHYRVGFGERLPVADDEFDLVYCCDVLAHVSELDAVISETARAEAGGIFPVRHHQSNVGKQTACHQSDARVAINSASPT
jgi:2-polyprenyl-6-hydroxyphenyl methylase / 3-demethylubiquinone-9 3-methyltransferase